MERAALLEGLSPDTPLYKVAEGNEPSFFTRFFAWDAAKAVVCILLGQVFTFLVIVCEF